MQALARAREVGATQLVVAKLDRLSRSPFVLLTLEAETKRAGLRLTSAAGEGTEDDDPASVLVRRMLQAVAEHELAMISARTKAALAQKKARGERLGRPPYGFSVQQGDLVPNDSFPMLYEAYRLRSGGLTMRAIVDRMMLIDPDGGWNLKRVHSLSNRWKRNELEDWNVWYGNYGSN
jgi:DNA invertase Pin-like site-specific DNA recombinase